MHPFFGVSSHGPHSHGPDSLGPSWWFHLHEPYVVYAADVLFEFETEVCPCWFPSVLHSSDVVVRASCS